MSPTATTINFGDGLSVSDEGGGVITVSAGGGSAPADATTSSKGVVQLAGDLAGTAASPQIAAGAIVDADIAAAAAIGVAKLAAGSNGQVLTTVSGAPAWATPATVSYGTTLPASPVDGQEAILVDSTTNPSYQWRFRYNAGSSSTYKWEYMGGSFARAEVTAYEALPVFGAWQNLGTNGPAVVAARAGDYDVLAGAVAQHGAAATKNVYISAAVGDTNGVEPWSRVTVSANAFFQLSIGQRFTGVSAGATIKLRYFAETDAGVLFGERWLRLQPIRVS